MTVEAIIAMPFLVGPVGLVLWNIRGHPGEATGPAIGPGPDGPGTGTGLTGE